MCSLAANEFVLSPLKVIASDSAGANSLSDAVNVSVLLLNDFQRVRIIFGSNQSVISGKQDFIVRYNTAHHIQYSNELTV